VRRRRPFKKAENVDVDVTFSASPNEELRDQINKAERASVSTFGFWSFVIHSGIRVSEFDL
jgi:hypothetical protein